MKFLIEIYIDTNHPYEKYGSKKEVRHVNALNREDAIKIFKWKNPDLIKSRLYVYSPNEKNNRS